MENKLNKNLFLLLLGRTVSDLGSSIQMMIMPLYIIDIGKSARDIGLFSFLYLLPILIIFPFAGVMGDKLNRKKIMVLCDFVSGSIILMLGFLSYIGQMNFTILIIGQMAVGASYGFFDPSSKGMLPTLVERDKLTSANSKVASLRILASMLAPIIGAFLYSMLGVTVLLLANGISFVFSAVTEMFIDYKHAKSKKRLSTKNILSGLKDGFSFVKEKAIILKLCLYFLVIMTFIQPIYAIVLPLLFKTKLSFTDVFYGYSQMVFVGGMLLGSVMVGLFSKKMGLKRSFIGGNILLIFALFGFSAMMFPRIIEGLGSGAMSYFVLLCISLLLFSASLMFSNIPVQTFIQKSTPKSHMSRVFSIVSMITKAGAPIGSLIFGFILEGVSIHATVFGTTIVALIIIVLFMNIFNKDLDKMEETNAT